MPAAAIVTKKDPALGARSLKLYKDFSEVILPR